MCWRGSVKTPFKAQVRIALDIGGFLQLLDLKKQGCVRGPVPFFHMNGGYPPGLRSADARFHLHRLENSKHLACLDYLPCPSQDLHDNPRGRSRDFLPIGASLFRLKAVTLAEDEDAARHTQMKVAGCPNSNRAAADAASFVYDFRASGFQKAQRYAVHSECPCRQTPVAESF